jgi:outer membrane biosynthesis protein TonB
VSIEVQCPNPDCAKVHRVKNRWAGKRGTCPDCGAIIEVPGGTPAPAAMHEPEPFPEPEPQPVAAEVAVEEGVTVSDVAEDAATVGDETVAYDPPPAPKKEKKAGKKKPEAEPEPEEEATVAMDEGITDDPFSMEEEAGSTSTKAAADDLFGTEAAEEAEEAEEEAGAVSDGRRFSGLTAFLYLLGILGLLGVAAIPFLPGPEVTASGPNPVAVKAFKDNMQKSVGIKEDKRLLVTAVPAAVAALALIALLVSVFTRNFGIVAFLLSYPAWIASLVGLLFTLVILNLQMKDASEAPKYKNPAQGVTGWSMTVGQSAYVGVASAGAAALFFTLAIPLMHRSRWSRIVFGVLAVLGLGGVGLIAAVGMSKEDGKRSHGPGGTQPAGNVARLAAPVPR